LMQPPSKFRKTQRAIAPARQRRHLPLEFARCDKQAQLLSVAPRGWLADGVVQERERSSQAASTFS
jgi:hypothetical protein